MTKNLIIFFCFIFPAATLAQTKADILAINNYINFSNECTHGMLIVHRLLENFNQEVNKFVDLESHQINFYSNNDLPSDIFQDPDHWFYDKTPYEWYALASKQKMNPQWQSSLNEVASQMRQNIKDINQIRFEAADFIANNDLNERQNQERIYEILEKGVRQFEKFYDRQKQLDKIIKNFSASTQITPNSFYAVHEQAREMVEDLRYKEDNNWEAELKVLEKAIRAGDLTGEKKEKLSLFLQGSREFINTASVPAEYRLYGKYYYYHNSRLLNYMNRYGNGYVNAHNESIDPERELKLLEVPHFYQVIYPSKWMEDVPLVSTDPVIVSLPKELKERKINVSDRVITVDSEVVEIEIFDHQMIDGDIVSVNFNGDWILEDFALKGKPYPLKVKLNRTGKNYLLLHAINLGKKPPNTMAMRYKFRGKTETVVLSSDLDESEVIELELVEE